MGCCTQPAISSPPRPPTPPVKHTTIVRIPSASAHLLEGDEALQLARGDFSIFALSDGNAVLATFARIGDLAWPLTRDEPVVKLDELHYLFSLPGEGGQVLNYGVTFRGSEEGELRVLLDRFLKENTCFSYGGGGGRGGGGGCFGRGRGYWGRFVGRNRMEEFNGMVAKAIQGGTGKVVKGVFTCTDAYANQVQKGAALLQPLGAQKHEAAYHGGNNVARKKPTGSINRSISRVRKLSKMTEKVSRSLLNGVVVVTGTVATPVIQSKAGTAVLGSVPGQVLLASLDAVNVVLDAVEAAEKRTIAATGGAVSGVVSKRYGESAGQATEDVFATVGHCLGTAWNLFKIRKAITPSSSASSALLKQAIRKKA